MRKIKLLLCVIMFWSVTACAEKAEDPAKASQSYPWIVATDSPADTVTSIYANKFAQEVMRLSEGRIQMQVYENGTLGGDRELLESCMGKDIPFILQNTAPQVNFMPELCIFDLPVAYTSIATLGAQAIGSIARTTRSAMLDVIHQDYIRTSRSRGVPERVVIYVHAFKNALIPILTAVGLRFGGLLAGATLVETVFSIPGVGRFVVDSVSNRDYPAVQGAVLILAVTFVVVNTAVAGTEPSLFRLAGS